MYNLLFEHGIYVPGHARTHGGRRHPHVWPFSAVWSDYVVGYVVLTSRGRNWAGVSDDRIMRRAARCSVIL
jgi:hypothetical protein